ncbi:response regulator transcription factor [Burkholderia ambifaria]|uniref:response regulator transcription factor n=1 Tax=Burkholderia ambifaria TaxID=152480 RepID=UPI001B9E5D31|nr:response regulator transcription factor [Burkholderia ambifaria]MBR8334165.1 response regulator transcription factor [Burkholderia ambifaria]
MSLYSIPRPIATCAVLDRDVNRQRECVDSLDQSGYKVATFATRGALLEYLRAAAVELVLIGARAHDDSVVGFVEQIRSDPAIAATPLLVLGPADDVQMVDALIAGADAYLAWPVSFELLIARIRALQRRVHGSQAGSVNQSHGRYVFFSGSDRVCLDHEPVLLTRMEYRAAHLLFTRKSRVVTFDDLWRAMWEGVSQQEPQRHNVCVHISRVRNKLKLNGEYGYHLVSVRGSGYKLVAASNWAGTSKLSRAVNY